MKCRAITSKEQACSYSVAPGEEYCGNHQRLPLSTRKTLAQILARATSIEESIVGIVGSTATPEELGSEELKNAYREFHEERLRLAQARKGQATRSFTLGVLASMVATLLIKFLSLILAFLPNFFKLLTSLVFDAVIAFQEFLVFLVGGLKWAVGVLRTFLALFVSLLRSFFQLEFYLKLLRALVISAALLISTLLILATVATAFPITFSWLGNSITEILEEVVSYAPRLFKYQGFLATGISVALLFFLVRLGTRYVALSRLQREGPAHESPWLDFELNLYQKESPSDRPTTTE